MDTRPVKIYTKSDVPRLRYIAGILLGDILGLSWEVITDKRKLGKYPVINYSIENISGSFKISPDSLLFEKGTSFRNISVTEWKGLPVFFPSSPDSDLPFDIFAASFFLVTRYEEYLEFQPDEFGRFPASESLASRNGFLGIPIVDLWVKEMAKFFLRRFQSFAFKRNEYSALLTIDVDQPFAYQGKSLLSTIGGIFRDITSNDGHATERYKTIARGEKDPYEVFDYITETIEKNKTDVRFFFQVGDHSQHDKNPSWKNIEYKNLISRLDIKYISGVHPSFNAARNLSIIKNETSRLKSILGKEIILSRFHYLRLFMPQSYRDLEKAGITQDYSMGYPDQPGFRASLARPFFFYDVIEDRQTALKIFPFQVMDATLFQYKKLDDAAAMALVLELINETRRVGGLFVSIWHNTSLLETADCKAWRWVFEYMLKNQKSG
jgi:hypothetical protein